MGRAWRMTAAMSANLHCVVAEARIPAGSRALQPDEVMLEIAATGEDRDIGAETRPFVGRSLDQPAAMGRRP